MKNKEDKLSKCAYLSLFDWCGKKWMPVLQIRIWINEQIKIFGDGKNVTNHIRL